MDRIAPTLDEPVFAQIGHEGYRPRNMEWAETVTPRLFEETCRTASRIVSHAGIGTILTARRLGKPLIVFPRRVEFGEHRNDHQVATIRHLNSLPGVHVAEDEAMLEVLVRSRNLDADEVISSRSTRNNLIHFIRSQISA
jgi:UDP-N-acetylglucosamine transferase subunit ALG13